MSGGPAAAIVVFFVVVAAVVVTIAVISRRMAQKRRDAFSAYATQQGWRYQERDDSWTQRFDGQPFGVGHGRRAENVLTGQYDGRPFTAFDYVYRTTETTTDSQGNTTTSEQTHHYAVSALQLGGSLPNLHVCPEGFFGRAVGHLLNYDIQLESEEFNRAFTVTCKDRKFASDVLHPRLMEALLAAHRDLDWRFDGDWLLTVHSGRHKLDAVSPALQALDTIVDQVPDFVWADHGVKRG